MQVRKMYDHIETSIRNLKGFGIEPASYGALLIPVLTGKLPHDLRMIIARMFSDKIWDFEEILVCFKEELQAKERCTAIGLNYQDRCTLTDTEFTTSSFVSQSKGMCVYCRESYPPSKCTKVTDVSARRRILRKYARCFICLKSGHLCKNCTRQYKCNKCNNRHHISLCEEEIKGENPDNTNVHF